MTVKEAVEVPNLVLAEYFATGIEYMDATYAMAQAMERAARVAQGEELCRVLLAHAELNESRAKYIDMVFGE